MTAPALTFFGDDFTGASENLAQACRSGLKGRLFLETTDHAVIRAASGLDVIGIAGTTRAQSPEEMAESLPPAFATMASLGARVVQYKICSTFDSAVRVGNFAEVLRHALAQWPGALVPVLAATPPFGRYTAFSNHFSRHQGAVLRLDRNPALVDHPATPMREADLRRHLTALGCPRVGAVHLPDLANDDDTLARLITERGAEESPVVLDATTDAEVERLSAILWREAASRPVFALAAQGFAWGIGRVAAEHRNAPASAGTTPLTRVDRMLVLSGSCAVQTDRQLATVERAGWTMIELPAADVVDERAARTIAAATAPRLIDALKAGHSVAAFTARGAATLAPDATRTKALGVLTADLFRQACRGANIRRVCFAGGDSSSYAMTSSGADALDLAHFDERQGCHVFRLASRDDLDGTEVLLKGGQVGGDTFFLDAMAGDSG